MGKEKRLFLLAVMTVMMSTVGYSQKIEAGKTHTIKNHTDGENYEIIAGSSKDKPTKVFNETSLTFKNNDESNIVGIKFIKNNNFQNGKIEFTNKKNGEIKIEAEEATKKVTGINVGYGKLTNAGDIKVKGAKGLGIFITTKGEVENKGKISVENKGVGLQQKTGQVTNLGLIEIKSGGKGLEILDGEFTNTGKEDNGIHVLGDGSVGISQTGGTVTNKGLINVTEKGTGIEISNGEFTNTAYGASGIHVSGDGSVGISQTGGIVNNDGGIDVKNNGVGAEISGGTFNSTNRILVSSGTGIKLLENSSGTVNSSGTITISENGAGVEVLGGSFVQDGSTILISEGSTGTGIKVSGGTAESSGKIDIKGQGTGVDITAGTFTNKNLINAVYENSKGVKVSGGTFTNEGKIFVNNEGLGIEVLGGKAENKKDGTIEVSKGVGVKVSGGTFTNEGKINITGGYKGNTGIQLENSIFVNSGEITGKGFNGAAVAIQSIGGNNTVYLKEGTKISYFDKEKNQIKKGKIVGAEGIDILGFEKGTYSDLDVSNYEAITVRDEIVIVKDSTIELEYNKGTKEYLEQAKKEMDEYDSENKKASEEKKLTMSNSNLIIDFKDSLTNPDGPNGENPIIDVGTDGKLIFGEGMKIDFSSSDGRDIFNLNDALGLGENQIIIEGNFDDVFKDTAVWEYDLKEGKIELKKNKYEDVVLKSQLKDFAGIFGNQENFADKYKDTLGNLATELNLLDTKGEFTNVMAQISGGVHGYTVDIAAVNSRTLSNTMKERALTRDYLIKRPVSSWTQDIMYIDNNHRFGGLMDVDYKETGAMGISEKQILSNGRVGLVYGGSSGKADAEDNGNIDVDTAYFGGYYNHEFNDKWSLNSNANFVYTHNKVTRNVKIGNLPEETFKSNYPTYTVGVGSSLIYTLKDDLYNKAHFYAGIDVNRIMQGTITEDEDSKFADAPAPAIRKQGAVNDKSYYSIVPSAGVMVQNTGYIFDKKYRVGADLNWETEVGNIKDGKRLHMKGIPSEYKVGTTERENIFSYSLFGALNLTEDLAVNAKYTSMFSDEYDADMVSAGFEYKMDTMGDNGIFGPIFYGLENHKPKSDRWAGTFSLMLENEDASDRTYWDYDGKLVGGDYATSNEYKPKFTLSLNDKKTNWSYYFEGYYKSNDLVKNPKGNEADSRALRLHGEARWTDTYSKGKYGINIGYRHEKSNKPQNFAYKYYTRTERGVHQLRLTPNFTYELGNGFTFTGKTTGIFEYNYKGVKEGQMDFLMESEYGVVYTGFMPRWRMSLIYFRDDRWYDNSNRKTVWDAPSNSYTYDYDVSGRYQLGQIRPTAIYYFGNGGSIKFDVRIPLGNGQWYDNKDGKKTGAEVYEVRYGFNYYHPVTPGLTMNVGGTFLNIKNKAENGDVTRSYSFRPNIGFSYSF